MDAAPLVGTAGSYGLVRDLIQEGRLSDIEMDLWFASLAFQTRPTLEMIAIVSVSWLYRSKPTLEIQNDQCF